MSIFNAKHLLFQVLSGDLDRKVHSRKKRLDPCEISTSGGDVHDPDCCGDPEDWCFDLEEEFEFDFDFDDNYNYDNYEYYDDGFDDFGVGLLE